MLTSGDRGFIPIKGPVYGVLLNDRNDLDWLAPRLAEPSIVGDDIFAIAS
jgi:hypothetical protein